MLLILTIGRMGETEKLIRTGLGQRTAPSPQPMFYQNPISKLLQQATNCCPCYSCCTCPASSAHNGADGRKRAASEVEYEREEEEDTEEQVDPIARRPFGQQAPPLLRRKLLKSTGLLVLVLEDPYYGFRRRPYTYPSNRFGFYQALSPFGLSLSSKKGNESHLLVSDDETGLTTESSIYREKYEEA
jgi:hypothetical protein